MIRITETKVPISKGGKELPRKITRVGELPNPYDYRVLGWISVGSSRNTLYKERLSNYLNAIKSYYDTDDDVIAIKNFIDEIKNKQNYIAGIEGLLCLVHNAKLRDYAKSQLGEAIDGSRNDEMDVDIVVNSYLYGGERRSNMDWLGFDHSISATTASAWIESLADYGYVKSAEVIDHTIYATFYDEDEKSNFIEMINQFNEIYGYDYTVSEN